MTKENFQKSRSDEPLYFSTFLVEAIKKNNNKNSSYCKGHISVKEL